jgi:hypothetical protein
LWSPKEGALGGVEEEAVAGRSVVSERVGVEGGAVAAEAVAAPEFGLNWDAADMKGSEKSVEHCWESHYSLEDRGWLLGVRLWMTRSRRTEDGVMC